MISQKTGVIRSVEKSNKLYFLHDFSLNMFRLKTWLSQAIPHQLLISSEDESPVNWIDVDDGRKMGTLGMVNPHLLSRKYGH